MHTVEKIEFKLYSALREEIAKRTHEFEPQCILEGFVNTLFEELQMMFPQDGAEIHRPKQDEVYQSFK